MMAAAAACGGRDTSPAAAAAAAAAAAGAGAACAGDTSPAAAAAVLDCSGLNVDVRGQVLQWLAAVAPAHRASCRSLSHSTRTLLDSRTSSLTVPLGALAQHSGSPQLQLPALQHLVLTAAPQLTPHATNSTLAKLACGPHAHLLATLQTLDLSGCEGTEADTLAALLQRCSPRRLATLILPSSHPAAPSTSRGAVLAAVCAHAPQLQHLLGAAGDYVDSSDAASVAHLCSLEQLQSLDISTASAAPTGKPGGVMTPHGLQAVAAALPQLAALTASNALAPAACEAAATLLPGLTRLEFRYGSLSPRLSARAIAPLQASRSLRSLALTGLTCNDELLALLPPGLQELSLHTCAFAATPAGTAQLARCTGGGLASLTLAVSETDVPALAAALPALGSQACAPAAGGGAGGLTRLTLAVFTSTGGAAAASCADLIHKGIFGGLPQLRELRLDSNYAGIPAAACARAPAAPRLTRLQLGNHFCDAALRHLVAAAPRLRALTLRSCGAISDSGLAASVAASSSSLRSVRLELLRGVTGAGLAQLAAEAPGLTRVEVEGCRNVGAADCASLTQQLDRPELDVVWAR